jgi:hypothetical protein
MRGDWNVGALIDGDSTLILGESGWVPVEPEIVEQSGQLPICGLGNGAKKIAEA